MKSVPLLFSFFLALSASAYASVFFPHIHLHTFAPFLALLYSRCSRISSFWISSLCGLLIDVLGSELRFGVYALSFATATLLLYPQKKHFNDKPLALSLFTFPISMIITLVVFLFSRLSATSPVFTVKWIISDLLLMSFFDALYAFVWFSLPLICYSYLKRIGIRTLVSKTIAKILK